MEVKKAQPTNGGEHAVQQIETGRSALSLARVGCWWEGAAAAAAAERGTTLDRLWDFSGKRLPQCSVFSIFV